MYIFHTTSVLKYKISQEIPFKLYVIQTPQTRTKQSLLGFEYFIFQPFHFEHLGSRIGDLKQTGAAALRRRSASKFRFRRTEGQVNSVGP